MKKIYHRLIHSFQFVFILVFLCTCQQRNSMTGIWEGIFMDHYKIEIEFVKIGDEYVSGMLRLWDGDQQIQNDELTKIKTNIDMFSFYIAAKQTTFIGVIEGDHIQGNFIFPDGSKHKLYVTRKENLGLADDFDPVSGVYPSALLISDLTFTKEKLESLHPDLYQYQDENTFNQLFDKSVARIGNGQDIVSFYLTLAPFTTSVGCSHTGSKLPNKILDELKHNGNYFPAKLFFENDGVYFTQSNIQGSPIKAGDQILTINNHVITEIRDQIFTLIPSEANRMSTKYLEINSAFDAYYQLLDNNTSFLIGYLNSEGLAKSAVLESCNYTISKNNYPEPANYFDVNLPVSYQLENNRKTALLTIPTFGIRDIGHYNRFMDSVFIDMEASGVSSLIIDLRGNSGGHPLFAAQLFSYLTEKPFVYFDSTYRVEEFAPLYTPLDPNPIHFKGKVYVLTDGGCLSTAGHLISLLKYHNLAKFIGQEPGSSYICNDNSRQFQLPSTNIKLNIPTTIFQTAVVGFDRNTELLDYPVEYAISDVVEARDPILEKAIELCTQVK